MSPIRPAGLVAPLLLAAAACAAREAPPAPIAALLTGAEAAGERLYQAQCAACHALEPGANTAAAPTLFNLVGKRVAAEPDYNYSPALRAWAARRPTWTEAALDEFLANPSATVPGTEMGYVGLRDEDARATLIAWLRSR